MKKVLMSMVLLAAMAAVCSLAMAQEQPQQDTAEEGMPKPAQPMMGKGLMMGGGMKGGMNMKPMCPVQGMLMKTEMVAASDGGVIVRVGNKLMKYDKDLNLKKEVELKIDMEAMHRKMGECPMCKKMREECRAAKVAAGTQDASLAEAPAGE